MSCWAILRMDFFPFFKNTVLSTVFVLLHILSFHLTFFFLQLFTWGIHSPFESQLAYHLLWKIFLLDQGLINYGQIWLWLFWLFLNLKLRTVFKFLKNFKRTKRGGRDRKGGGWRRKNRLYTVIKAWNSKNLEYVLSGPLQKSLLTSNLDQLKVFFFVLPLCAQASLCAWASSAYHLGFIAISYLSFFFYTRL